MPDLFDLRIAIGEARDGMHSVDLTLEKHTPYPPIPQLTGDHLELSDSVEIVGSTRVEVSAALLASAQLPATVDFPTTLGDPDAIRLIAESWPDTLIDERMAAVGAAIFSGDAARLVDVLRQQVDATSQYLVHQAPDHTARISVDAEGSLRRVPWERLGPGPGWQAELGSRCAVVRRYPASAVQNFAMSRAPLKFPLRLQAYSVAPELSALPPGGPVGSWGRGLLAGSPQNPWIGGYVDQARQMGALEWEVTSAPPVGSGSEAAIHHLVFSSSAGPLTGGGLRLTARDGSTVTVPGAREPSSVERLVRLLESYGRSPSGLPAPRLLVLHDVGVSLTGSLASQLVYLGLAAGADAVLLVHTGTPDLSAGDFFPWFYRKIMHNWPLDHALLGALSMARSENGLPRGWVFAAREDGVLSLLLTRAVVDESLSLPTGLESAPSLDVGVQLPVPYTREARIIAELVARTEIAVKDYRATLGNEAEQIVGHQFNQEEHDLQYTIHASTRVRDQALAISAGRNAIETLGNRSAEQIAESAARLLNLWMGEPEAAGVAPPPDRSLRPDETLRIGATYGLHVQIGPRRAEAWLAEMFPEAALTEVFKSTPAVTLDVAVFAPPDDFTIAQPHAVLHLPRVGASDEVRIEVVTKSAGVRRLRVCIYYRNTMLQSMMLQVAVGDTATALPRAAGEGGFGPSVDYLASTDLALLEELAAPRLNIFTNDTSSGDHWVGVFPAGQPGAPEPKLYTLSNVDRASKDVRNRLSRVEALPAFRPLQAPPVDAQGHLEWPARVQADRAAGICQLAQRGRDLYDAIFSDVGANLDELERLEARLREPGLISVARCRMDGTTFPWAALYSLDVDVTGSIGLCPVFTNQLAGNRWQAGGEELIDKADLLDDPVRCRGQAACPLNGPAARTTVCPFGFWGFMHQVEQPLQQVSPVPATQVPPELAIPGFSQTSRISMTGDLVRVALGVYEDDALETDAHRDELRALRPATALDVDFEPERALILNAIQAGGRQVYYFYCHGVLDGSIFRLKVGSKSSPGYISVNDLRSAPWRSGVTPLVVLNGCETMALLPERINTFLTMLRRLGAAGVVGTEIEVRPGLARRFGRRILQRLLEGETLGEAFLATRRHLLRQYNPLGLAYTGHAPANLHLHAEGNCVHCART
jgi:hypothetical protein